MTITASTPDPAASSATATTATATTATATAGGLAALRNALPVLALGVATRAPRSGIVLDLTGTVLTLSAHDDDVTARVTITLPSSAQCSGRVGVAMKDLKDAVTALTDAGADLVGDLAVSIDDMQVRVNAGHHEHVLPAHPARAQSRTQDQASATVRDIHAAITVLKDTNTDTGRAVDHVHVADLRDVLTAPAGEFAASSRALARTATNGSAYVDSSMDVVPLYAVSIELPAAGTVHLASTDRHRFTRWDTGATWAHPSTRVLVRADQLAAATRALARPDAARPLTLSVAPDRVHLTTTTPTGTHEVTLAAVAGSHFPSLDAALVGGPRRIDLTRAAATQLARTARDQVTRYGPEARIQLRRGKASTLTVHDDLGFYLDDVPATVTGVVDGTDLEVTFTAAYLDDALTALRGAIVMTSAAAASDDVDDRTLPRTFTGTAPITVAVAPVHPGEPRASADTVAAGGRS